MDDVLNTLIRHTQAMPRDQLVLVALAMLVSLGGGNAVCVWHYRRVGKKWTELFNPMSFPLFAFDLREWIALLSVAATTLTLFALAANCP